MSQSEGRNKEALDCYEQYQDLMQQLHHSCPEQVDYANGFAVAKFNAAQFFEKTELEKSIKLYTEPLRIYENHSAKVPNNPRYIQNLNWLKNKIQSLS